MSIQQQQGDEERRRQEEEDAVNDYAEAMIRRDQAEGGFYARQADTSGWLYGAGERPSDALHKDEDKDK